MITDNEHALVMKLVSKRYGTVHALNRLTLKIPRGQIYGLLGPNGAGKTTALRIICGLLAPDHGEGHCLGAELGMVPRRLGYVPQRGGLYDDLTVTENLNFYARAHGLKRVGESVAATLRDHGLEPHARQRVGRLSGGWRQRIALAAALLHDPQLVLLDEPTAGLDPEAREQLWKRLHERSAMGVTMLVTSHYADEAERCDRIGYIASGKLLAEGPPLQFAEMLGIAVWRIRATSSLGAPLLPTGSRLIRDSEGWRVVTHAGGGMPPSLMSWCQQANEMPESIAPRLTDALAWIFENESTVS